MNPMTTTRKVLLFLLFATVVLVGAAFVLANSSGVFGAGHTLVLFDENYSDSVIGWMIAIPIVLVAIVIALLALTMVAVMIAIVMAVVLFVALVVAVFAVLLALIPVAAFLAVPTAIVWALIKVNRRNATARALAA